MRIQAFISLVIILFAFASLNARANSIANYPGWKLEKAAKDDDTQESGVIEYADYFGLYPNDTRPAITVDGTTANRILNGQLSPETVYFERTNGAAIAAAKAKNESSGNGNVGWQMAESTYVPLGTEGTTAKNMSASTSSSFLNSARVGNGVAGSQGANAAAFAAATNSTAIPGAVANEIRMGNSVGTLGTSTTGSGIVGTGTAGGAGGFSASLPAKAAAGTVVPYTGDASAANSNQTYSQMIDSAMSNASKSLCGRMGAYAGAGQCK